MVVPCKQQLENVEHEVLVVHLWLSHVMFIVAAWCEHVASRTMVGGPAQKMTFFQVVQKSFLSVPIYCSRCKYDSLDFFFKNIAWNLSVECVKHENVGSGRFSSRFLPGF